MNHFIVIEGLDGCGKSTQFDLLKKKIDAHYITFPYYNTESGKIVQNYLSGMYNDDSQLISAYSASAIYAVDRFTSYKTDWGKFYNDDKMLISARYVSSNAVYQLAKLDRPLWDDFLNWLFDFEYNKLGLPKPDLTVFLDMPIEVSQRLLSKRYGGDESQKDIHERNVEFLKRCRESAMYVGARENWRFVSCIDKKQNVRSVESINEEIIRLLHPN